MLSGPRWKSPVRIDGWGLAGRLASRATLTMQFGPQIHRERVGPQLSGTAQHTPSSVSVIPCPGLRAEPAAFKGSLGNCFNQLALLGPDIMPACFPAPYSGLVIRELACGSFPIAQAQTSHILPPIHTWNQNILALVLLSLLSPCASLTEGPSEILEVCSQAGYSIHSLKWDYSRDK